MGYSTNFQGELKFKNELRATQIAYLKGFLEKDRREIGWEDDSKAYKSPDEYWYHIDLELTNDFSGLRWNGAEKTYGMVEIVNFITDRMREEYEDFELTGEMNAQGDELEDRWKLVMEDGKAVKKETPVVGEKITCPKCEEDFILEGK